MSKRKKLSGRTFDALPAEEKERVFQEIEQAPPGKLWKESKPMTAADRKRFAAVRKKMGRPKIGKGSTVVSISVEAGLLKSADDYARRLGIGRTELFVRALRTELAQ